MADGDKATQRNGTKHPGACFCGSREGLAIYDFGAGGESVLCDACAAETGRDEGYDPAEFRTSRDVGIRTNENADEAVRCESCAHHVPRGYAVPGRYECWLCVECEPRTMTWGERHGAVGL